MSDCAHCDPDHSEFGAHPWSAFVSAERDGDGQPTHIIVARADGGHVAESDAEAVRALLRGHSAEALRAVLAEVEVFESLKIDYLAHLGNGPWCAGYLKGQQDAARDLRSALTPEATS